MKGDHMSKATARHIFVLTLEECELLKNQIEAGADFARCAIKYSICPTGVNGGELGELKPGQLIKELDTLVFNGAVGKVLGPIESQFGYHLVEVTSRS